MNRNEYNLIKEILKLSDSSNWNKAKNEWKLIDIYFSDENKRCLCGHYPIKEICILKNKNNSNTAEVGNICVNKFLGIPSHKIFNSIKKISKDLKKSLNEESLTFLKDKSIINDWEFNFYLSIYRKRKLTDKQLDKKKEINKKILEKIRIINA